MKQQEIIIKKGTTIKIDGIPFRLKTNAKVLGYLENLKLVSKVFKSFGDPLVLYVAQEETSETTKPSSESMKVLK